MTDYRAIADTETQPEAPITADLMSAFQYNHIAVAEADATVPLNLLPTVLLGAIPTTSGTSQTLTGLDLTPYRALRIVWVGVTASSAGGGPYTFTCGGVAVAVSANDVVNGMVTYDLQNGIHGGSLIIVGDVAFAVAGASSVTTATTSITITASVGTTFNGGSVRVYGLK